MEPSKGEGVLFPVAIAEPEALETGARRAEASAYNEAHKQLIVV